MTDLSILAGYYTYRSFLNTEQPVEDFNKIRFAEAEVFLRVGDDGSVSGTLAFPAGPASPRQSFMDLSGSVTSWKPLRLRFTGQGRVDSAIADFTYEYDCILLPEWPAAKPPQRFALAGTVLRAKDHGTAKAGVTASFVAVKRDIVEPRDVPGSGLIPEAVAMLASRAHRLRHTVWHTVRDPGVWWHEQMTAEDREYIRARGWFLDDPPFRRDVASPTGFTLDLTNGAGEDFLYMHRRMIAMVKAVYEAAKQPPPQAWTTLPGPATPQFAYLEVPGSDPKEYAYDPAASGMMVPPATPELRSAFDTGTAAAIAYLKTDRFFTGVLRNLVRTLRSPSVLAQLPLGAYGNLIEFTVHNWMHLRWAGVPRDPETGAVGDRADYDIATKWDAPTNDYLGNFHSSHVNPIFWRLHGWVDDCVRAWFEAHEAAHPGAVKQADVRGIPWFTKGPWVVKVDPFDWPQPHGRHRGHGHGDDAEVRAMVEVMERLKEVANRPTPTPAAGHAPTRAIRGSLLARRAAEALQLSEELPAG